MYTALIGAGLQAGGNIANAYGQSQALQAMRELWDDARREQAGYDQQVQRRTDALLRELALGNQFGQERATALQGTLDRGSVNLAGAVKRQAARRPGRGGAEGAAVRGQANAGTLASALKDNRVQALLAGLMKGRENSAIAGGQYALDTGRIRDDARAAAGLMGQREQLASQEGMWARSIGSLFDTLGQGVMMYGMSQPQSSGAPAASSADVAASQAPVGGWAAGRTYNLGGGATGAWS